jgi:hypothetical protein
LAALHPLRTLYRSGAFDEGRERCAGSSSGFAAWNIASPVLVGLLALREWRGASRRTKVLVASGLFLLVSSTIVVGHGNYLKANESTQHVAGLQRVRTNE